MEHVPSSDQFEDEFRNGTDRTTAATTASSEDATTVMNQSSNKRSNSNNIHQNNKLGVWQGTALLTADCLGVGILALPQSIHVLGWVNGLAFLILQLPINYYSGYILAWTAVQVENEWKQQQQRSRHDPQAVGEEEFALEMTRIKKEQENDEGTSSDLRTQENTSAIADAAEPSFSSGSPNGGSFTTSSAADVDHLSPSSEKNPIMADTTTTHDEETSENDGLFQSNGSQTKQSPLSQEQQQQPPTQDLVAITTAVYDQHHIEDTAVNSDNNNLSQQQSSSGGGVQQSSAGGPKTARNIVMLFYYLNIFLVLGDYILVMSHAVAAIWPMCITTAGLIASTLMFAICQLNTMALLGQYVSIISLVAMLIVLGQCIYARRYLSSDDDDADDVNQGDNIGGGNGLLFFRRHLGEEQHVEEDTSLLRKFSALASICFAVGSQKLFLNIRYELNDKESQGAPVLARSLFLYGMAYILVILLSGSNPPAFLFDAIPEGTLNRRIAGLLLWGHVAVSYAINSQALCSSLERFFFSSSSSSSSVGRCRWIFLTFGVALTSYLVANGIPFFKDLVALIGSLTTVPITLTLPPVLYQHWQRWTRLNNSFRRNKDIATIPRTSSRRDWADMASTGLILYSIVVLGIGLAGSLASVKNDWQESSAGPFACNHS